MSSMKKHAKRIIDAHKLLMQQDNLSYSQRSLKALSLLADHHFQKLEWFNGWVDFIARNAECNSETVKQIPGLWEFIEWVLEEQFGSSDWETVTSPIPLTLLANCEIVTPRYLDGGVPVKPEAMFYLLNDLYENDGDSNTKHWLPETIYLYEFENHCVLQPQEGATHRAIGLALSYGLLEEAELCMNEMIFFRVKHRFLRPLLGIAKSMCERPECFKIEMATCTVNFKINGVWHTVRFDHRERTLRHIEGLVRGIDSIYI